MPKKHYYLLVSVITLLMLGATIFAWNLTRNVVKAEIAKKFQEDAAQIETWIQERLNGYTLILSGARAFVERSELSTAEEWKNYIKSLDLYKKYPVSSALYIENTENKYLVKYVEPQEEGQNLIGIDMKGEEKQRKAFEIASNTGEIATTGKIQLSSTGKDGFLIVMPVYRNSPLHSGKSLSGEVTGSDLLGFVALSFDEDALFKVHFKDFLPFPSLDFEIYQGDEAQENLIYDHNLTQLASSLELNSERKILSSGDFWTLSISPLPTYKLSPASQNLPLIVLVSGMALTLLFAVTAIYLPSRIPARIL